MMVIYNLYLALFTILITKADRCIDLLRLVVLK